MFPDDSDRQLRENQSKQDLRLISCLEALVILSHCSGAEGQFD